ncbi:MAG: translation initiation factor IF-2 [Candidatus Thermofonsia Clade 1 bacterium]|uniref:Translation initiation factor IF-2 n=1 Tax=Candidatus Thermofonsia Clade 1 bacterium TaxID=2364210 RepID=A0A2M8P0X6_9CHLR|nr:MAG: translation initiation factor IF-2 [Candidatus Thermofonsia Clade 1 bacterium]
MAEERQLIEIPEFVTVRELASLLGVSPIDVMKQLISNGVMATINQQLDFDTASLIAEEMGFEVRPIAPPEPETVSLDDLPPWRRIYAAEDPKSLVRRPPVVTILGHVDHGKTTLLDAIRHAHVAEGEAGGITQHIGAYQVVHNGQKITFLDTPGHAAFTAMRARGAQGADIAVLVVAADDGVMPTAKEAIAHARAAHIPMVVAINKIDKRNANPERVKQELAELGVVPDEWDGDTMFIPVSARDKIGIEDLLEAILLTAENHPIHANPKGKTAGTVIEARLDKTRGVIATLLVQNGTLRTGDIVVAGTAYGKIRAMFDENGKPVREAPPSTPVQVMGFAEQPHVGDLFVTFRNEREARALVEERKQAAAQAAEKAARPAASLEDIFKRFQAGETKELLIILKVDTQGSLEPIVNELNALSKTDLGLKILYAEVGNITENDVNLATSTGAIVIGFNVNVDTAARKLAESNAVEIRLYDVIYNLVEDVEKALKGMLEPVYQERVVGVAEVRKVFKIPKLGKIAGCMVREGEIRRNAKVRLRRGREIVAEGIAVASLKRETEDVREVRAGFECGVGLDNYEDFIPGDLLEFMVRERVS